MDFKPLCYSKSKVLLILLACWTLVFFLLETNVSFRHRIMTKNSRNIVVKVKTCGLLNMNFAINLHPNERTNGMTIFAMFVASKSKQTADSVCLPITQCSKRINLSNSAINIVTLNYSYIRLDPAPAPANTSTKDEIKLDVVKLKRLHQENWYKCKPTEMQIET